jgi:hypothetical protein
VADELNLYRIAYSIRRRRCDGKKRKRSSSDSWIVAAHAEEAIRRHLANSRDMDDPSENWTRVDVEVTGIEQLGTLRRCPVCREFRCDDHKIHCLCEGLRCKCCGRMKMHRPISNYYDEREGWLCHVPWFCAPRFCRDCRAGYDWHGLDRD